MNVQPITQDKILLVASSLPPLSHLISELFGGKEHLEVQDNPKTEDAPFEIISKPLSWIIDNKYYRTELSVHWSSTPTSLLSHANMLSELGPSLGALILIWDPFQEHTLKEVYKWKDFIEEYQPPVLLCVQHSQSTCDYSSSLVKECEEWCLENGLESVSVTVESIRVLPADCHLEEKVGLERISEALEANVWPNLRLKNDPFSSSKDPSGVNKNESEGTQTDDETQNLSSLSIPAIQTSGDLVSPSSSPAASEVPSKNKDKEGKFVESLTKLSKLEDLDFSDPDNFEQLFSVLQPLRQQGQSLPDDQRRELAARVALLFASQFEED